MLLRSNIDWFVKMYNISNRNEQGIKISEKNYYSYALSNNKYVTYDTYENRFVSWAIKNIIEQLRNFKHT